MFGVASDANVAVWMFVVVGVGSLLEITYVVLQILALENAYSVWSDSTQASANVTAAEAIRSAVQQELALVWSNDALWSLLLM